MARCEYYQHSWGDRCVIKGKLSGSDSDAISDDTYRRYCTYSDGYVYTSEHGSSLSLVIGDFFYGIGDLFYAFGL